VEKRIDQEATRGQIFLLTILLDPKRARAALKDPRRLFPEGRGNDLPEDFYEALPNLRKLVELAAEGAVKLAFAEYPDTDCKMRMTDRRCRKALKDLLKDPDDATLIKKVASCECANTSEECVKTSIKDVPPKDWTIAVDNLCQCSEDGV
jgi:hypothetical protein